MNNQKICLSKQTTFIALVLTLLFGYVVFAYTTMINKTSTNSRASATTKIASNGKGVTIPKSDCYNRFCQTLSNLFALSKLGEIQFINPEKNEQLYLDPQSTYAMFYKDIEHDYSRAQFLFLGNKAMIYKQLQKSFKPQGSTFNVQTIQNFEFYIEDITPLDNQLVY